MLHHPTCSIRGRVQLRPYSTTFCGNSKYYVRVFETTGRQTCPLQSLSSKTPRPRCKRYEFHHLQQALQLLVTPRRASPLALPLEFSIPIAGLISFLIWRCRARKCPCNSTDLCLCQEFFPSPRSQTRYLQDGIPTRRALWPRENFPASGAGRSITQGTVRITDWSGICIRACADIATT